MEPILLRPVDAAMALGISRSRIYELIRAGSLPSVKVGGVVRVPVGALREWVAGQLAAGQEVGR